MVESKEIRVGIDLGTTNTLASYYRQGKPDYVRFPGSGKVLPSTLYMDRDGKLYVGEIAKKKGKFDPLNRIRSSKTHMGDFEQSWTINGRTFGATEAATEILREVKAGILKRTKSAPDTIVSAVITVPAYFNSNQTDETKKAGENAGLNVLQIITEPMAAAIAAVRELDLDEKVFVVDLGGGTFDLSVLEVTRSEPDVSDEADQVEESDDTIYRAVDLDGDSHLGGDDFDTALYQYCLQLIESDLGLDLSSQESSGLEYSEYYSMLGSVREGAELAKIDLSSSIETIVAIPELFNYNGQPYNFEVTISREEFDDICEPLYERIFGRIRKFIETSGKFSLEEISTVILAGGSCYIPRIREEVERIFNRPVDTQIDLTTIVVDGACFVANTDMKKPPEDILSHSLGVEVWEGGRSVFSKLLSKGEVYPCQRSDVFTTTEDNQKEIPVQVYEAGSDAENELDINCHDFYGELTLTGIDPAPEGVPAIEVTFSYDISRCLTVTATDKSTGREVSKKFIKGLRKKPTVKPIDFMLLLDASGSMEWNGAMDEAKIACTALLSEMIDFKIHRMGLVSFGSHAILHSRLTQDANFLKQQTNIIYPNGGTYLLAGLHRAYDEVATSQNEKVFIIVTDGDPHEESDVLIYAENLRSKGIRIVSIGTGKDVREDYLHRLSSPGDVFMIEDMSKLEKTFREVIARITKKQ